MRVFESACLRSLSGVLLMSMLACSSDPGGAATDGLPDAAPNDASGTPVDVRQEVGLFDDAGDGSATGPDSAVDAGSEAGAPCSDNADCDSGLCLVLEDGDSGFCSSGCVSDADCPVGFECLTFTDSGEDAVQRCVPSDLCIDRDNDLYGVGPGCRGRDCDDDNAGINPAADEVCDGVDQDCDDTVDENPLDARRPCDTGFAGRCSDGITSCTDGLLNCDPVATVTDELCDGVDNDCNGTADDAGVCAGEPCCYNDICEGVCASAQLDVSNACTAPAAFGDEVCDGIDNDCDGVVDEQVTTTFFLDFDEDGFGDPETSVVACVAPDGYVQDDTDCNDDASAANPDGVEVCDELDNNCDGMTDEGVCAGLPCCWQEVCEGVCATALTGDSGECTEPDGFGADVCDGLDNDCDGTIDEEFELAQECTVGRGACERSGRTVCAVDGAGVVCNAVAGDPVAELCDALDNDCDGTTDEDFVLAAVCSVGRGECERSGRTVCAVDGTSAVCDAIAGTAGLEVCDGLDNDCDGAADEGFDLGTVCTVGRGACATSGVRVCAVDGSASECNAMAGSPVDEICDELDNDCDGSVDEGNPGGGVACSTGESGVCEAGTTRCTAGVVECQANRGPSTEVCDTLDNNCNGTADEGFGTGGPCTVGTGACARTGTWICNATGDGRVCSVSAGAPTAEVCDNVDNDCDGSVDEGNPGGGASCLSGQAGVCSTGVLTCSAGSLACVPSLTPGAEVCDTLDNNCNGTADEGFGTGGPCTVGLGACARTGTWICNATGDGRVCSVSAGAPTAEVCDNVDNDCDGSVDEGNPGGGASCTTTQPGICAAGTRTCVSGSLMCVSNETPVAELCDLVDNNCDGTNNEGFNVGTSCASGTGECRRTGVRVCNGAGTGTVCNATAGSPAAEVCDGLDNDCDGTPDDGFSLGGSCAVGVGACRRTGTTICNGAGTGTQCSVAAGSPGTEICGNGVDEDCNGSDLACPSACSGVTRTRVWIDEGSATNLAGFAPEITALFQGGGRTVTTGSLLFPSSLSSYDVIVIDKNSLSSSFDTASNQAAMRAWIQAGGALYLASENQDAAGCNSMNAQVSGSGLSWSCDSNDIRNSAIDTKFNLLSGVSGNLVNVGNYLEVLGSNATRLAGPDSTNMVGRYTTWGCGSVIIWGDVEYGKPGNYTGNTPAVWALFRDFLLTVP